MSEPVESRLQDLLRIEQQKYEETLDILTEVSKELHAKEEEIEALHIALRASGERREKAERQVSELEQRVGEAREPSKDLAMKAFETLDALNEQAMILLYALEDENLSEAANEQARRNLAGALVDSESSAAWLYQEQKGLRERVRQMEEALREIAEGHGGRYSPDSYEAWVVRRAADALGVQPRVDAMYALGASEPSETESESSAEGTSDFYLDSFHRTWNREF